MLELSEYQYLLVKRESRVVIGKRAINLWLLVLVLLTTFFAIAFSAGSLAYLDKKMSDPFTNWVNIDIRKAGEVTKKHIKDSLDIDSIRFRFLFNSWQPLVKQNINLVRKNGEWDSYSTLYFDDMSSDLIAAILEGDNVICSVEPDSIGIDPIGVISTLGHLEHLGYSNDNIPAFIDYYAHSPGADSMGVEMLKSSPEFTRAPLPLLAVVKRLPMSMPVIAALKLCNCFNDNVKLPFSMNKEEYARKLLFYVPQRVDFSNEKVINIIDDSLRRHILEVRQANEAVQEKLRSWMPGKLWEIKLTDKLIAFPLIKEIERCILNAYASSGVQRVYDYNVDQVTEKYGDDFIAIHFTRLDSIRSFRDNFVDHLKNDHVKVDMTQVESKETFAYVSAMANILTVSLIIFSIIAIVIFIVNMMQSYFQKVKRNLGTFKAFGISTKELIMVYMTIIVGIVLAALAIALCATWCCELLLNALSITKPDGSPHLALWNARTLWAIVIILVSTVLSVLTVMRRLLRHTPGDLIYDR